MATDVFEENLQDTTCLLVDKAGNTLDASSACKTADGRFGNTCVGTESIFVTCDESANADLGCCREEFCDDAWRRPFRVPAPKSAHDQVASTKVVYLAAFAASRHDIEWCIGVVVLAVVGVEGGSEMGKCRIPARPSLI